MPAGKVSTTSTGSKSTSPVLVTVIVNVTSVNAAPLVGFAVFTTLIPGTVIVTGVLSLAVTGSPMGGLAVTSTQLVIVPDASLSILLLKETTAEPPSAANDPTLFHVTVHVPFRFTIEES